MFSFWELDSRISSEMISPMQVGTVIYYLGHAFCLSTLKDLGHGWAKVNITILSLQEGTTQLSTKVAFWGTVVYHCYLGRC